MLNVFFPIYKNLEKELIALSESIHFDDKQINIYSIKIADLLTRCVMQIESIAKELYKREQGDIHKGITPYFDTDCLKFLEEKWQISKKIITVSSSNMYFTQPQNQILTPLKKSHLHGDKGCDWKKAYQAVKHDLANNLSQGTVKNLIRAMAALYLLNIYFLDRKFALGNLNEDNFSASLSDIFSFKVHRWHGTLTEGDFYVKKEDFDECLYFIKWEDEFKLAFDDFLIKFNKNLNKLISEHPKVTAYISTNCTINGQLDKYKLEQFIRNRTAFQLIDMESEYPALALQAQSAAEIETGYSVSKPMDKFEAVLNLGGNIYPETPSSS